MAGLAVPAAATAQVPARDSVTGAASWESVDFGATVTHEFSVFSGASGENAVGTFVGRIEEQTVVVGEVTCLHVTGNRAVIGLDLGADGPLYLVVVDGGPTGQDEFAPGAAAGPAGSATECATFSGEIAHTPYTGGDVVVTDAQPSPTTKAQCKNGGWRNFGTTFKNHGQCVAFVERGPKA